MKSTRQMIIMTLSFFFVLTLSVNAQESITKKKSSSKTTSKEAKAQGDKTYLSNNPDFNLETTKIERNSKKPSTAEKAQPETKTIEMETKPKPLTTNTQGNDVQLLHTETKKKDKK